MTINTIRDFSHIGEHAATFAANHAHISFVMFSFLYLDADVLQAAKACTILSTMYIKVDDRHNVPYFVVHDATRDLT